MIIYWINTIITPIKCSPEHFWRPPWGLGKMIPGPQAFHLRRTVLGGRWERRKGNHGFVFAILPLTRTAMHLFSSRPRTTTPPRTHRNASQPAQCLLYRDSARSPDRLRFKTHASSAAPPLDSWRNRHRCMTGEITVANGCGEIIIAAIGLVEEPLCRRQTRIQPSCHRRDYQGTGPVTGFGKKISIEANQHWRIFIFRTIAQVISF